jgi:hypothetical protein
VVSIEAEYWQTATAEQRRVEETTAAKRFIATSLAKSVDKYGARIKELTTRDRDSPERPDFPEVLSACRATLIMSPCGDISQNGVNRSRCAEHGLHCESNNYNAEPQSGKAPVL